MNECAAILTAEALYTAVLRDDPAKARPGSRGSLDWSLAGCRISVEWELRPNAVWRFGRLFFRCPKCARLATRVYLPQADAGAACRRCWGLTYESRQQRNYKGGDSFMGRLFSQRALAHSLTYSVREGRAAAAAKRYAERRAILSRVPQPAREATRPPSGGDK